MTLLEDDGVVAAFATGLVETVVRRAPDGRWVWHRRAGALAGAPLGRPPGSLARLLVAASDAATRFELPARPGHRYLAGGYRSLAQLLVEDQEAAARCVGAGALHHLGAGLGRLHRTTVPAADLAALPAGVTAVRPCPPRVPSWLDGDPQPGVPAAGPGAAQRLRRLLDDRLGHRRVDRLRSWALESAVHRPVVVHGAPSLGVVVPPGAGSGGPLTLFAGETVRLGLPADDVGWVLGELAELHWAAGHLHPGRPLGQPVFPAAAEQLLRGWAAGAGPDVGGLDAGRVARTATLRTLTHVHDFAAYVGWPPEMEQYVDRLAELVDEEGGQVLRLAGVSGGAAGAAEPLVADRP